VGAIDSGVNVSASDGARTARLSALEREVAGVLAILGHDVSLEWLQRVTAACGIGERPGGSMSKRDLATCVSRLAATGLVHVSERHCGSGWVRMPVSAAIGCLRVLERDQSLAGLHDRIGAAVQRPGSAYGAWDKASPGHARVAAVRGDWPGLKRACVGAYERTGSGRWVQWLTDALGDEPERAWLDAIPESLRNPYCRALLKESVELLAPSCEGLLSYVRESAEVPKPDRLAAARFLVLAGRGEEASSFPGLSCNGRDVIAFLEAFWRGDHDEALRLGDAAVARRSGKQLAGLEGVCHALTRIYAAGLGVPGALDALEASRGEKRWSGFFGPAFVGVERMLRWSKGEHMLERQYWPDIGWLDALVAGVAYGGRGGQAPPELVEAVQRWWRVAQQEAYVPVVRELAAVRQVLAGEQPVEGTLTAACRVRPEWEQALDELEGLGETWGGDVTDESVREVFWQLSVQPRGAVESSLARVVAGLPAQLARTVLTTAVAPTDGVQVRIVPKTCVDGTPAEAVCVSVLADEPIGRLSEEDRRVIEAIDRDLVAYARYGKDVRLGTTLVPALVGHPRVVLEDGTPVAVVKGEVSLVAQAQGERMVVRLEPAALQDEKVLVRADGARIEVFVRTAEVERVMKTLRRASLEVPVSGMARLERALRSIAGKVRVRLERRTEQIGTFVEPKRGIVAQAHWDGRGLRIWLRVAPLGEAGPLLIPGGGEPIVIDEVAGKLLRTERDFDAENEAIDTLLGSCPVVQACRGEGHSAYAGGLADAYAVLLELVEAQGVSLAWPKGKKLALPLRRGSSHFGLRVSSDTDWLSLTAELTVGEGEVIGFEEIVRQRLGSGRFILLEDGRVLALARDLARRLDALARVGASKAKAVSIRPAVLPLVVDLIEGAGAVDVDAVARAALERARRAAALEPEIPRGLQATLRPYQQEGFAWMSRLAAAGLGACLADDMGLGKTIQAVAILCARASDGPALVVAPTSVVHNWLDEVHRFAPELAVQHLGDAVRAELIEAAGPGDVIVCSYGVLVAEAAALSEKRFATLVVDEAHAVKNATTQRARAVFGIAAGFRLALTGTPIENHLGELWSVMEAAVPGLLGDQRDYLARFAKPIIEGDREVADTLRELVRPFVLRRTREQVLDELPPCTDIVVTVDPGPEEEAYYEALRRLVEEEVRRQREDRREDGVRLLAEITRLRRAAIDPRLVDSEAPAGAKVDAVVAQVKTLREQGHRALVFTQFLGSMGLLRQGFEAAGIAYLELEGSTSAKVRAERIEAFQRGEGDVFLMSLRAGGVGVNLTGADYVIHVDPWWNPAVEDQATARAHRMGQTRPVTVYRMVTRGTIEERILELHEKKRHLAEDILDGMERSRKLTLDELRTLLGG
jgi:superfamily II DNA or RNA helicase